MIRRDKYADVDGWIERLTECKPLAENEVKRLCEKVEFHHSFIFWRLIYSLGKRDLGEGIERSTRPTPSNGAKRKKRK